MKEDAFWFGENNRGFGIVTLPEQAQAGAPVVVLLNAGLLHREEPYRLNVLAGRALAAAGYICIRVDLSGKGDTPTRPGLSNRESVARDWQCIKDTVTKRFGERNIVIMGLCSGADNGVKIMLHDENVVGLILIDLISPMDAGFNQRRLLLKLTNRAKWLNLPTSIANFVKNRISATLKPTEPPIMLRDEPTPEETKHCFEAIVERKGQVLAVFTSHALKHYNQQGQLVRALNIPQLQEHCEEVFWPYTSHLFPIQAYRDLLVERIAAWGKQHLQTLHR